jgi:cell wall-associated NlpC family hydrolase
VKLLAAILSLAAFASASRDFVSELRAQEGKTYSEFTCSALITRSAHRGDCKAAEMWNGCGGALVVVEEVPAWSDLHDLKSGDVLVVNGAHVAAYLGGGEFIDSTPERGVSRFTSVNSNDPWYSKRVRVLRWR